MTHARTKTSSLFLTLVALMVLLALSVVAAHFTDGRTASILAMAIATAKAVIVGLFFMDLRRASSLTRLFATAALLWLFIMLVLTMCDYVTRGL